MVVLWQEGFSKMIDNFFIDGVSLTAELDPTKAEENKFTVQSVPFPYSIELLGSDSSPAALINSDKNAIVLIDSFIKRQWLNELNPEIPIFEVDATEANKTIYSAINFAEFMESIATTKSNMVYVVGGGILQDIGAFACAMYKRGIPWTYLPTTLLGMTDSCIGGKTGLNHSSTKNLIALFAAPHRIIHFLPFLNTLPRREVIAGYGEALRLHVTGGPTFLTQFEANIEDALDNSQSAIYKIIYGALSVKRAVVEKDEFEKNLRRSMNYGHSVGHAIESLTDFAFPHGMGISLGIMVENMIAVSAYGMLSDHASRINDNAIKLIDDEAKNIVTKIDFSKINSVLLKDKKTLGKTLKMAIPLSLGKMMFHDFQLDNASPGAIRSAFKKSGLI